MPSLHRAGTWSATDFPSTGLSSAQYILENLATYIGGSPYYAIQTTYPDVVNGIKTTTGISSGVNFKESIKYAGSVTTTTLSDADLQKIVSETIYTKYQGSVDSQGLYMVLTAADVTVSYNAQDSFCTQCEYTCRIYRHHQCYVATLFL